MLSGRALGGQIRLVPARLEWAGLEYRDIWVGVWDMEKERVGAGGLLLQHYCGGWDCWWGFPEGETPFPLYN